MQTKTNPKEMKQREKMRKKYKMENAQIERKRIEQ